MTTPIKTKDECVSNLKNDIVKIVFTKVNGEQRVMYGSLRENYVQPLVKQQLDKDATKKIKAENPNLVNVIDLELNQFRSFDINRLISFETVTDVEFEEYVKNKQKSINP